MLPDTVCWTCLRNTWQTGKHIKKMFTGLSRDYPGTVLAFSADFLGIMFMCFPFCPGRTKTHKHFDPHPFPGQSREVAYVGDHIFSQCGNCARPMRLPDPSPILDKNHAPIGSEFLSSTGAGVWRKAPMAFPDSNAVLDKFQSAIMFIRAEKP